MCCRVGRRRVRPSIARRVVWRCKRPESARSGRRAELAPHRSEAFVGEPPTAGEQPTAAEEINNRPRKTLGWARPDQLLGPPRAAAAESSCGSPPNLRREHRHRRCGPAPWMVLGWVPIDAGRLRGRRTARTAPWSSSDGARQPGVVPGSGVSPGELLQPVLSPVRRQRAAARAANPLELLEPFRVVGLQPGELIAPPVAGSRGNARRYLAND